VHAYVCGCSGESGIETSSRALGGLVKWANKGGKDMLVCMNRVDNSIGAYFEGFNTFFVPGKLE